MSLFLYFIGTYILLPAASLGLYAWQIRPLYPPDLILTFVFDALPGVLLFCWFMSQFITGSRLKILERGSGLPAVLRLHVRMNTGILVILVFHAIRHGLNLGSRSVLIGLAAGLIFLLLGVVAAVFWVDTKISRLPQVLKLRRAVNKRLPLQYKDFRILHNVGAVTAAFLAMIHFYWSTFFEESFAAAALLTAYFVLSMGIYLRHKILKPVLLKRNPWRVTDVVRENDTVCTIRFEPVNKRPFSYKSGQFGFFTFLTGKMKGEEHPFSFSSSSESGEAPSVTVQANGDFTNRIMDDCAVDDLCICDAPYGNFVLPARSVPPSIFIAGGIGTAPFIGIIKDIAKQAEQTGEDFSERISFYWLNHNEDAFVSKIMRLAELHVKAHLCSRRRGTPFRAEQLPADFKNRTYYVCASREVTESVLRELKSLGIPPGKIKTELFSM